MRILRSLVIGGLCIFPSALIGLTIWYLLGSSFDTSSISVITTCNLIPLGGVCIGFWISWKNGEAYALSSGEDQHETQ